MNYLLTEREFKALCEAAERANKMPSEAELQKLCTEIADTMPVNWGWGGNDPKPWGCILSKKTEWYCDSCPVQDICPFDDKEWSK
jgi:hypothetical protein